MNTTLHSFIDIFGMPVEGQENVKLQKISIPIIQRDYAQGRCSPAVTRVRKRFLESLHDAFICSPITLDFVYGDIDKDGIMTPLDGQQRLTTLFLLHWYATRRAEVSESECSFLSKFSYETRYSARYFCEYLIQFTPSFERAISEEIIDQPWFPLDWKKDPTISSMLVMLDAIDDKFKDIDNIWEKLKIGVITFYFLPIKDMGLTDELYIKMNSRGRPLTQFEHFKAEFERCARNIDEALSKRIMQKIDGLWADMLWQYRDSCNGSSEDLITDDEFLKYFHFICDVICYQRGESPQGKSMDEFDMLMEYFSGDKEQIRSNIELLESYFDCWCSIDGFISPAEFLKSYISHVPDAGKIVINSKNKIDIFEDCLHNYADRTGNLRQFPLNRLILLYAIVCFLRNRLQISDAELRRRLRIINNLIQNSPDEISDRSNHNHLPAILRQTDAIMLNGKIDNSIENGYNVNQIKEEIEKKDFLRKQPECATQVFALEDHPNLRGQISIVGLDHIHYAERFQSLFRCSLDLIDCAMMSIGDYGQQERNKWRYQYASRNMQIAWDNLFHKSFNKGFENTRAILLELLSRVTIFSDEILRQIIQSFIMKCENEKQYTWRYYYVKYNVFRPGSYGKYYNNDASNNPYLFSVMQTSQFVSSNAYIPFLKAADEKHLARDFMGQRLVYDDKYLICENSAYVICSGETDEEINRIKINQNEHGIDIEDRILCLKKIIREKLL